MNKDIAYTGIVDKSNEEDELEYFINGVDKILKYMFRLLLIIGIPFMISLLIQFFILIK